MGSESRKISRRNPYFSTVTPRLCKSSPYLCAVLSPKYRISLAKSFVKHNTVFSNHLKSTESQSCFTSCVGLTSSNKDSLNSLNKPNSRYVSPIKVACCGGYEKERKIKFLDGEPQNSQCHVSSLHFLRECGQLQKKLSSNMRRMVKIVRLGVKLRHQYNVNNEFLKTINYKTIYKVININTGSYVIAGQSKHKSRGAFKSDISEELTVNYGTIDIKNFNETFHYDISLLSNDFISSLPGDVHSADMTKGLEHSDIKIYHAMIHDKQFSELCLKKQLRTFLDNFSQPDNTKTLVINISKIIQDFRMSKLCTKRTRAKLSKRNINKDRLNSTLTGHNDSLIQQTLAIEFNEMFMSDLESLPPTSDNITMPDPELFMTDVSNTLASDNQGDDHEEVLTHRYSVENLGGPGMAPDDWGESGMTPDDWGESGMTPDDWVSLV
ncbi:hypothetical protein Btru_061073 [Bulinus truncatus]|nr:hypothetical protein Btru_061073 [Bulinus truncatus]